MLTQWQWQPQNTRHHLTPHSCPTVYASPREDVQQVRPSAHVLFTLH